MLVSILYHNISLKQQFIQFGLYRVDDPLSFLRGISLASLLSGKTTLILPFSAYNSKTSSVTTIFYHRIMMSMTRCNVLQSLKNSVEGGSEPPFNVALKIQNLKNFEFSIFRLAPFPLLLILRTCSRFRSLCVLSMEKKKSVTQASPQ